MSIKFAAVTKTINYPPDPIHPAFHRLWIIFFLKVYSLVFSMSLIFFGGLPSQSLLISLSTS